MRTVRLSANEHSPLRVDTDTLIVDDVPDGAHEITVHDRARLVYASVDTGGSESVRLIRLIGPGSSATIRSIASVHDSQSKRRIETRLEANETKTDILLLSLAHDGSEIDLDGILAIPEGVRGAEWSLEEHNIFLGNTGKIRWLPTLLVHSDEVRASHAMRVERVSAERIFYLRSRGFSKHEAIDSLTGAQIRSALRPVAESDPAVCAELLSILWFSDTE